MPLLKDGRIVDDPRTTVADDAPVPADRPVIVSLARWTTERDAFVGRKAPLGIRLASGEAPAAIAADLDRFGVIALEFPHFKDGRAYSSCRLLRERHGYAGEVRAVGNVLRDQYLFMARVGFDAFEVKDETAVAAWAQAMSEMSVFYQPTADGRKTAMMLRHQKA
jgi:uncharacterized protein (DUF934 family)